MRSGWSYICMFITMLFTCSVALSQPVPDSIYKWQLEANTRVCYHNGIAWVHSGFCKTLQSQVLHTDNASPDKDRKITGIRVHGNVQYDFLYRSLVDTPFSQRNFSQHSVRTNINVVFKNNFPVQAIVLHRNSNSPYFRDITDVTFRFRQQDYLNGLKEQLLHQGIEAITARFQEVFAQATLQYQALEDEIGALENWLASPARLQELVVEKERLLKGQSLTHANPLSQPGRAPPVLLPPDDVIRKAMTEKINRRESAEADSILELVKNWVEERKQKDTDSVRATQSRTFIEKKKQELAEARRKLAGLEQQRKDLRKNITDSLQSFRQEIARLRDPRDVKNLIRKNKTAPHNLPRGWQFFSSIQSIGIGRTWIDYTELTVKNISLNGVNIEMNPGNFYFAAAAGRINYRFRDFIMDNTAQSRQSLYLLRAGLGRKDASNFIVTWYDGKRSMLNSFSPTTVIRPERVLGMSAEARWSLNENQFLVAEFAKSSFHTTGTVNAGTHELLSRLRNFKDRSNEAYSVKVHSYWPQAGTKFTGYYKKMGAHFQSFNLQPVNSIQEAYQFKLQQSLWKKRLTIDAGVRKNDYTNPLVTQAVSSKTVFKSVQLSLRIPRYPYLTIGFAPTSQLTVIGNQRLVENQYNTLNAVATYTYRVKKLAMTSNAMYLRFFNQAPDTGFIYYNASSFAFTQFLFAGPWQIQAGVTVTKQKDLEVFSIDKSVSFQLRQWLQITGGLTYNRVNESATKWGNTLGVNMIVPKLGAIQLGYEKSYLPGTNRDLLPVETGRLTYTRTF